MENIALQIWNNCLQIIKDNINFQSFKTWFIPIVPLKINNNILTIQVPSNFFYEYLEENYIDLISTALRREMGPDAKLEYSVVVVDKSKSRPAGQSGFTPGSYIIPGKNAPGRSTGAQITMPQAPASGICNPFIIPGLKKITVNSQLNPGNTIDNFVEGECNRLVRSAAVTIAGNPGKTAFNPLMIYGASGVGKTHLAQAIGNSVKELYPDKIVLYVSANKFQTQYTDSVRNNTRNDFMHFYQMLDVLILDDVQELESKSGTQDVFFHIFNQLHQSGKQLILTCDKPPAELKGLSSRLLSRFKWGLMADIQAPDFPTRVEILRKKSYAQGIDIPEEVIQYVANTVVSNVRELEGALISLVAQSTLARKDITLELAKYMLEKIVRKPKRDFSLDQIQKTVCDQFRLDPEVLAAKSRKKEILWARNMTMYLAKNLTQSSLQTIGTYFSRDHSTVLHSCKCVSDLLKTDRTFKTIFDEVERKLKY